MEETTRIYHRLLCVEHRRAAKTVELDIFAEDESVLNADWQAVATDAMSTIDLFFDDYDSIPTKIQFYTGNTFSLKQKDHELAGNRKRGETNINLLFSKRHPSTSMDDLVLPQSIRSELEEVIFFCKNKDALDTHLYSESQRDKSIGVFLNFWGPPGTGKTMAGEVLANSLQHPLMVINAANLESEFVGRTSKHISKVFDEAAKDSVVLMLDEADCFLSNRIRNPSQSADHSLNASRSQLLKELETFQGIVIFATNHMDAYDNAFQRRIHYNIHFPLPDDEQKLEILKLHLVSDKITPTLSCDSIVQEMTGFSGGDIRNVVRRAVVRGLKRISENGTVCIRQEEFFEAVEIVKMSKKAFGEPTQIVASNNQQALSALKSNMDRTKEEDTHEDTKE